MKLVMLNIKTRPLVPILLKALAPHQHPEC
jgi:hypothetical protein